MEALHPFLYSTNLYKFMLYKDGCNASLLPSFSVEFLSLSLAISELAHILLLLLESQNHNVGRDVNG